jgi:hypothetical protein
MTSINSSFAWVAIEDILSSNSIEVHDAAAEPWRVTLVDTGEKTMIGGRIKRILPYLGDDEEFYLTYRDGVGNIDVRAGNDLHRRKGWLATVTATQPPGRFGAIDCEGNRVTGLQEKPRAAMAAFSSCRGRSGAISRMMRRSGSRSRWSSSRRNMSSASISVTTSGSLWIHYETSGIYGPPARRRGKIGERERDENADIDNWKHGLCRVGAYTITV